MVDETLIVDTRSAISVFAVCKVFSFTNLSPTYIANVPKIDGWGEFYQYGSNPPNDSYAIASGGRNKNVTTAVCGTTTNFNDDIYYSNGTFVQWPEGTQF